MQRMRISHGQSWGAQNRTESQKSPNKKQRKKVINSIYRYIKLGNHHIHVQCFLHDEKERERDKRIDNFLH